MAGITIWNYFSGCLSRTSNTFVGNAGIFGKVYFPRLAVPISTIISGLISFGIQLALFVALLAYQWFLGARLIPQPLLLLALPLIILQISLLGLGFGIIISSLTTKYRDFSYLVGFGMQLWMYATPIVYPMSQVPQKWLWLIKLNPMSPMVELFRYAFVGVGTVDYGQILTSFIVTIVVLFLGIVMFSRVEKSFMDTV
jgi:lipopolysaccharide transport system permease protein